MDKIAKLEEQFTESANAHVDSYLQSVCSTELLDRDEVERAVTALYKVAGLKKPLVIYCQSPWQLCFMPVIISSDWFYQSALHHFVETSIVDSQVEQLSEVASKQVTDSLLSRFHQMRGPDGYGRPGKLLKQQLNDALFENFSENFDVRAPLNYFELEPYRQSVKLYKEIYNQKIPDLPRLLETYLRFYLPEHLSIDVSLRVGKTSKSVLSSMPPDTGEVVDSHFFDMSLFRDIAHFDFTLGYINEQFAQELKLNEKMNIVKALVKAAPMYLPFENFCFVCERPTTVRITDSALDGGDLPALEYEDGLQLFSFKRLEKWRKMLVPPREAISIEMIKKQENIEIRRVMIELYGPDRFIKESGFFPVKLDKFGGLFRRSDPGFEDIVMVRLSDATPMADGKFREYWLRVPPHMKSPRHAVAWSFHLSESEYHPDVET